MIRQDIFSKPIFKWNYGVPPEVLQKIEELSSQVEQKAPKSWACRTETFKTSFADMTPFLPANVLQDFANTAVSAVNSYYQASYKFEIGIDYWYNKYSRGDWQEAHTHTGSLLSAVWFLKNTPQNLTFYTPSYIDVFDNSYHTVEANEGDIVLFPSDTIHYVKPVDSDEERVTVAFNIHTLKRQNA